MLVNDDEGYAVNDGYDSEASTIILSDFNDSGVEFDNSYDIDADDSGVESNVFDYDYHNDILVINIDIDEVGRFI